MRVRNAWLHYADAPDEERKKDIYICPPPYAPGSPPPHTPENVDLHPTPPIPQAVPGARAPGPGPWGIGGDGVQVHIFGEPAEPPESLFAERDHIKCTLPCAVVGAFCRIFRESYLIETIQYNII